MAVRFRLPAEALRDGNGNILALGSISFYDTQTLNLRSIYSTDDRGTLANNPYSLDSAGEHGDIFLADADYRVIIKDANGATVPNGDIDPVHGIDTQTVTVDLEHTVDGGGLAPSTGVTGYKRVDFSGTITRWTLEADQSGNLTVDVWKKAFSANSPPTVSNTITASDKPKITSATSATGTALTGWTTTVSAGDDFGFNIDSIATITRFTLTLTIDRTLSK